MSVETPGGRPLLVCALQKELRKGEKVRLAHRFENGVLVIRVLDRRLDALLAEDFMTAVDDFLQSGPHLVVLDISKVEFIDSRGLGVILALYKRVASGGEFAVSGARESILSLFRLARVDNLIAMYATEEEAIEALEATQRPDAQAARAGV